MVTEQKFFNYNSYLQDVSMQEQRESCLSVVFDTHMDLVQLVQISENKKIEYSCLMISTKIVNC